MRRPTVYFSFRSPYSWLAMRRLRELGASALARIDFVPYWDPDADMLAALRARGADVHYAQMSKAKHLYILRDAKRLTRASHVSMAWPIDVDCWWEVPHLAWLAARELSLQEPFYDAVVAARWQRGADVCTRAVMARIASEVGLEPRLADCASHAGLREQGLRCLQHAYDDGVFGVPFFRVGARSFWGLERVPEFLRALDAPHAERAPVTAFERTSYDEDLPGGCG